MGKEKGITVIALVIILVILVVAIFTGFTIFFIKQSQNSQKTNIPNPSTNTVNQPSSSNKKTKVEKVSELSGQKYEENTEIEIGDKIINIPGGFTISGIPEENSNIETGLVIYMIQEGENVSDWNLDENDNGIKDVQEKYDQFVWIPVEDAIVEDVNQDGTIDSKDLKQMMAENRYPMAMEINDTGDYRGILYEYSLDEETNKVKIIDKSWSTTLREYREPTYLGESDKADGTNYNNIGITQESLQQEFNEMVKEIRKNHGFWIGRYETSNMKMEVEDDNTSQVKIVRGTSEGISNMNWYRMYKQQENYSLKASVDKTSSMIWGSQWDQVMIWMQNEKNINRSSYYILNSITMGNFGIDTNGKQKTNKEIENTGTSEKYKVKNIFDLAGNIYEMTLEAVGNDSRVVRGGYYYETSNVGNGASKRNYDYPIYGQTGIGTRMVMY